METFTPSVSPLVVVPLFYNMIEQQSNILKPLDEHVGEELDNDKYVVNEQMIPQEIAL